MNRAKLDDLVDAVKHAERGSVAEIVEARSALVEAYPDAEESAEAAYKLGLHHLFHGRDLPIAVRCFEQAVAVKASYWSDAARTSLGLCYYHQGEHAKALLELRRVGYAVDVSAHSVTAMAFLENILETGGQHDEAVRVRKDRMHQLRKLIHTAELEGNGSEQGFYLYQLAISLLDQGDEEKAEQIIDQALDLGKEVLGAELQKNLEALQDDL